MTISNQSPSISRTRKAHHARFRKFASELSFYLEQLKKHLSIRLLLRCQRARVNALAGMFGDRPDDSLALQVADGSPSHANIAPAIKQLRIEVWQIL